MDKWIDKGVLVPWEKEVDVGVLPLAAVLQLTKRKVRLMIDFRGVKSHVECHMGGEVVDVCEKTLRKWRRMTGASKMVDLKSAYLQLRVSKKSLEVLVGQVQRKNLLPLKVRIELGSKNYVNNFKEDIGEDGWHR